MGSPLSGDPGVTTERFTDWKAVLDPEYRFREFPGLDTPVAAVVRWVEVDEREQPTGAVRENPEHRPGPLWLGYPAATTRAGKLLTMRFAGWIDDETLRRLLLDCEVLVLINDDGSLVRGERDQSLAFAYTSSTLIPSGWTRWRRIRPRDLLRAGTAETKLVLDDRGVFPMTLDFARELRDPAVSPAPENHVDEVSPEVSPRLLEIAPEGTAARKRLQTVAGWARKNGFELTADECERYVRAYSVHLENLRAKRENRPQNWPADLAGSGLITHYDDAGQPSPVPWTFGKFESTGTTADALAWHRILGAYVGFAVGECLVLRTGAALGPLTRQLLRHSETVMRGLPFVVGPQDIPDAFPAPRPDSWLAVALGNGPEAPSAPLTAALAATVTAGVGYADNLPRQLEIARKLTGADGDTATAIELLVRVFSKLLVKDDFVLPVHVHLREMQKAGEAPFDQIAEILLALRDGRDIPDVDQAETIGDPANPLAVAARATFAAAKRHYDARTAIEVAAGQSADPPLAAALAGAMVGARGGVPNLPADLVAALGPLGLLDNVATDVFRHFGRYGVANDLTTQRYWPQRYPKE